MLWRIRPTWLIKLSIPDLFDQPRQCWPRPANLGIHDSLNWNGSIASLSVSNLNSDARGYTLNSNAVRRPDSSIGNPRHYSETSGKPIVRTGNNLFDSLFSLAYYEMTNTLSVNEISDDAYNGGDPITCFKTGVKWPYVWTRDSAYSVALSLGQFDPVRAMNTLNFKVSDRRGNPGKPEIIQDTGSGGQLAGEQ